MEYHLSTPLRERDVRELSAGDVVYITGHIFTARDEAHHKLIEMFDKGERLPFNPEEMALFHCGPVMRKIGDRWSVFAAGPTTSARMEMFEYDFLKRFRTRMIIGKGGMGEKTARACREFGAVYTSYTGGAGALAATSVKSVEAVYWLEELGMPEAVWILKVENFGPLIVGIDAKANSLYRDVEESVAERVKGVLEGL